MADLATRLRSALGERYRVEDELGAGGMAVVFRAHDLRHDRPVALKVLRPELATAIGADRFLHEIRLTAGLQHPHILPLYDSGEADGLLFYVMPLVAGESLRQRLARERQLPLADAIRLTGEIADALAAAHARGIVHRDVKPDNILLSGDHALVADFGIARAVEVAGAARLTATGLAIGTPGYMAPEQAGDESLDQRADVYALACVAYEMLSGDPPFTGATAQAVLARQLAGEVRAVATVRPLVPRPVDTVLARAMAAAPGDRPAGVREFARELERAAAGPGRRWARWVVAAAVLVVAGALLGYAMLGRHSTAPTPRTPAVAVLPFRAIGESDESRYWSAGVTEDIRTKLGRVAGIRVIAIPDGYAPAPGDPEALRRLSDEVRATLLLDGSVRLEGTHVRVVAHLLAADGRTQVWGDSYDTLATDVFSIQAEIAERVTRALDVVLSAADSTALRPLARENPQAYAHYLRGRFFWGERSPEGNRRAVDAFEAALAVDPAYPRAYAGLADAHVIAGTYAWGDRDEEYGLAERYARRALQLDPRLAEAHATLGTVALDYLWDWDTALRELHSAIALDSSYATAHAWLALAYAYQGRADSAWAEVSEALRLDPFSPVIAANAVAVGTAAGRVPEAVAIGEASRSRSPDNFPLLSYLALAYAEQRNAAAAVTIGEALARAVPGHPVPWYVLARAYVVAGDRAAARRALTTLYGLPPHPEKPYVIASVCAMLGDAGEAFRWLDQAFAARSYYLAWLNVDPGWAGLRADPRYRAAIGRRGLSPPSGG
jgi:serine/threonine-protein kinase